MKIRLGRGLKSSISEKISDNTISEGTLVFTRDTNELVLVDENKDQVPLDYRIKEDIQVQNTNVGNYKDGDVIPMGTTVEEILKMILQKEVIIIESPLLFFQTEASFTDNTKSNYINNTLMENTYEQYEIDSTVASTSIELVTDEGINSYVICIPTTHTLDHIEDEYTNDTAFEGIFNTIAEPMTITLNGNEVQYNVIWYSARASQGANSVMTVYLDKVIPANV